MHRESLTAQITILPSKCAKRGRLTVDMVLKSLSGPRHISRLTLSSKGLYDVARTYESSTSPVDIHRSYHPSGEMHSKLTRGRLALHPGGQCLGEAQPHTGTKQVLLWRRKGQPWQSLRGVEKFGPFAEGFDSFTNVQALKTGYPAYRDTNADYVFEIDADLLLPSGMIAIEYFLVEPGNAAALESIVKDSVNSWRGTSKPLLSASVQLFTSLKPWLAIALFTKKITD